MSESINVTIAFCKSVCTEESSDRAYNALLSAVGNNHAGTYDSSALDLVAALAPILNAPGSWPQRAALEVMIDLYASFEPEPGCHLYEGQQLAAVLRQRIAALEPNVVAIAATPCVAASSAQELLGLLHGAAV